MSQKSIFLYFTISLISNSTKVFARSINIDGETETANGTLISLPSVLCIMGVVAVVSTGGFCLFSSKKKHKNPSEEYLTNANSNTSSSSSTPNTSNSELHQLNRDIKEDDVSVKVDKMENNSEKIEEQPKRRSVLDSILNRNPKKDRRLSNIQFKDDRSLNSISTNEDWINEQKLQAEIRQENQDGLYNDEDEEVNSNDGFWNSDLQPIQSSSDNKQKSYGVPSLGKRNSVIVKGGRTKVKRQSVIIMDDEEGANDAVDLSEKSNELKPTRVKSWKNSDFDEEIKEILKNIDDEDISLNNNEH